MIKASKTGIILASIILQTVICYAAYAAPEAGLEIPRSGPRPIKLTDKIPPTGSININKDRQYTRSQVVALYLSAVDNKGGSGIDKMKFSENNSTWLAPTPYMPIRLWKLSKGDGIKKVYVKFSDKAGNWSGSYSGTITLDTTPPRIAIISPRNGASVTIPKITMTYISDSVKKTKPFTLREGPNKLTITETDPAGNTSSATTMVTCGQEYTIISRSYPGGTISPSGAVTVEKGDSQIFNITPRTGFRVSDLLVDGVSQGALTSYEFKNVTSIHTIIAKFLPLVPSNLQVQRLSLTEVKLSWTDNASNQAGWMVQISTDGVNFTEEALITPPDLNVTIAPIGGEFIPDDGPDVVCSMICLRVLEIGGQPTYTFKNLTPGATYYFRVGAVKVYDCPGCYDSSEAIQFTLHNVSMVTTTIDYSYDDLNRLETTAHDGVSTTYVYDEAGNIKNKTTE